MRATELFLQGIPWNPYLLVGFFLLSILTLLFSMIVSSRLAGGIDFGTIGWIIPRAAGLVLLVAALQTIAWGILLSGPVWFFGLMFLFQLDFPQARVLTKVNWSMNCLWKALIVLLLL